MQDLVKKIEALVEAKCSEEEFQDCFLLAVKIEKKKQVKIFIDSDEAVTFAKCRKISRVVEEQIEENNWLPENYKIEVSSPGAERPLKMLRQYHKHIGRDIIVETDIETVEGQLISVGDKTIEVEQLVDKKKKLKEVIELDFDKVKKANIKITIRKK